MTLKDAILDTASYYAKRGEIPSPCDTRCMINDLIKENPQAQRYNQISAHKAVIKLIGGYNKIKNQIGERNVRD